MKTKNFKLMILINSLEDVCGGLYSCTPVVYFSLSKLIQGVFPRCTLIKTPKAVSKYPCSGGGIPYGNMAGM